MQAGAMTFPVMHPVCPAATAVMGWDVRTLVKSPVFIAAVGTVDVTVSASRLSRVS